jgi:Cation transport protein
MPHVLVFRFFDRYFPKLRQRLRRTVTIPMTTSLTSQREDVPSETKSVPYISFDVTVGRNSAFHLLTREQMEELGGVEYRALNALLWIVAAVCSFLH